MEGELIEAGEAASMDAASEMEMASGESLSEIQTERDALTDKNITDEEFTEKELNINKNLLIDTSKIISEKVENIKPITSESLTQINDSSIKVNERSIERTEGGLELNEYSVLENSKSIKLEDNPNIKDANISLRGQLNAVAKHFRNSIERIKGKETVKEYDIKQNNYKNAVENGSEIEIKQAKLESDEFAEKNLKEVDEEIATKTKSKGTKSKQLSKILPILKLIGIAGIIGLLAIIFHEDDGCWKIVGGVKQVKINDFDFSGDNKKYCSCSDNNNFSTPEPLSSWCPDNVSRPEPTYVTCPPYQNLACTKDQFKDDSIYYSYYITSPLGVLNTVINTGTKLAKDVFSGVKNVAKYVIPFLSLLTILWLILKQVDKKFNYMYLIIYLIIFLIGIGGYLFF